MVEYVNCQNCANKKCSRYGKDYGYTFCNYFEKKNKATHADRIRAMSDEELAEWLCSLMTAECCDQRCPARDICNLGDNGLVKWMKQPAEED